MKKLTLTIVFILSQVILFAQTEDSCLPEGINFTTQQQIDDFQINYPNCTEVEGNVFIGSFGGTDITNLNGLSVLISIQGDLTIGGNDSLTNLEGLEGLLSVGGELHIGKFIGQPPGYYISNPILNSLDGLSNLSSIGGSIELYKNNSLTNLTGLENLTSINGNLEIKENQVLVSLSGLNNVSFIEGSLEIRDNALTSLNGLENVNLIGGELYIASTNLASLTGLSNLESVGSHLTIKYTELTNFSELLNLYSIGGRLDIMNNWYLTSLYGLDNINAETITNLRIKLNYSLSTCEIQSVCDYLTNPNGTISISDNAPGCNSPAQVQTACEGVSIKEFNSSPQITISPNPAKSYAFISLDLQTKNQVKISIFNTTGVCLKNWQCPVQQAGQKEYQLNLSIIPPGIYFCRIEVGNEVLTKKIIKL